MHQVGGVDLAVWTGGRKGSKRPTKLGVLRGHKSFDEFCVFLCVHSQPVCVGVCVCVLRGFHEQPASCFPCFYSPLSDKQYNTCFSSGHGFETELSTKAALPTGKNLACFLPLPKFRTSSLTCRLS